MTYNPTWIKEAELQDEVNSITVSASSVDYENLASQYSTAQEAMNQLGSAGLISGGVITEVDTTTISVASGTGMVRTTNDSHGDIVFIDFPANASIVIPADESKDVVVNYNSGTPIVSSVNPGTSNANTQFLLGQVGRGAGQLFVSNLRQRVSDFSLRLLGRLYSTDAVVRSGNEGLILGESGDTNRYVTMTSGSVWALLDLESISAFNSGTGDEFVTIYRDFPTGYVETSGATQWPADDYDDGTGTLSALSNNRYGVRWFWMIPSDETMFMVYGTGNWKSLAEAEAEPVPTEVPDILTEYGVLIGKIIVQKGVTIAAEVSSAFEETYNFSGVTSHGNLSNLAAPSDDHTQYAHIDSRRAFTNTTSASSIHLDITDPEPPWDEGVLSWDNNDHTLRIFNDVSAMAIQLGQETVLPVRNETGSQIDDGTPVYLSGVAISQGQPRLKIAPAKADDSLTLINPTVATHDIPNNTDGYSTLHGFVRGIDTSAFIAGVPLFVSPVSAGEMTQTPPISPNRQAIVGVPMNSDATSGALYVNPALLADKTQVIVYTLPLTGVVDVIVPLTGSLRLEDTGETGDVATDWAVSNQHVWLNVNSLTVTGSGNITITGASVTETTATPSAGDTETLSVTTTGAYQTNKKWWEVTNIDIPADITAINYDYGEVGYVDLGNRDFIILGYRCESFASGVNPDFRLVIQKVQDNGSKTAEIVTLEDIGVDSGAGGDQIVDHIRTGADDRSFDPDTGDIWDNDTQFVFKQLDFTTYFQNDEFRFNAENNDEGYIIRIQGEGGGISNVDFIIIHMYFQIL